jgi:predicted O-methyltransferase YrrM
MNTEIFLKVDKYISDLLATEDQALADTIKSLDKEGLPQHSVSANQGKFLQVMMIACNAKKVLELGTLGGYSTIWLARALPDNGKVITIEVDKHHGEVAKKNIDNAGLSQKVDLRVGKALDILPKIIAENEGPFDMIFIDADKLFKHEICLSIFAWGNLCAHSGFTQKKALLHESPAEPVCPFPV